MSALGQFPIDDVSSADSDKDDDDDYNEDSGSSSAGSIAKDQEEERTTLARNETIAVFRLRLLVFMILLMAAVAVSLIVFFITSGAENKESESQYEGAAEKVLDAFIDIVESKLASMASIGVAAIAHGIDNKRTWPFLTLSSFQQRAATAREESGALYIHINPMVSESNRQEWEEYVVGEDSWM
jgi:hypothetical protein